MCRLNISFKQFPDDMADKITTRNDDGEFKIWEEDQATYDAEPLITKRETLELVRAYYNIPNQQMRKKFFELCKSLSADTVPDSDDAEIADGAT